MNGSESRSPTVLELAEWQDRPYPGVRLTPDGRALAERLAAENERRIELIESLDGLRVRTSSWVGVVRLDDVEIRVVPKLAGDPRTLARLVELAGDPLEPVCGVADLDMAGSHLLDLVAVLLARECFGVVRRGLLAGYVEREDALPVMRGRLLADRQVLQRFGRLDRLECRFDELELDIDENRLLAAALRVAHQRVSDGLVRHRLASLRGIFEPICDEKMLDLSAARGRMRDGFYDRLNAHYWPAHRLAWLLLEGLGVEDLLRRGDTRCFAFLLDMNALFQGLVERLFRTALPSAYDVEAQAAQHSIIWNVAEQRSHSSLIPDLLVRYEPGALRLAVDAKYKLYDERRIDPSDVYQTFLYAYALGAPTDGARPSALIVYPASGEDPRALRLRIQPTRSTVEADIETLAIDIPNVLNELYEAGPRPMLDQVRATVERLLGLRSNESVDN